MRHPPFWGNVDIIRNLKDKFVSVNLHMNNYACIKADQLHNRFYKAFAI